MPQLTFGRFLGRLSLEFFVSPYYAIEEKINAYKGERKKSR